MKYVNSYIFLKKEKRKEKNKELEKNEKGEYILRLEETFYDLLKKIFDVKEKNIEKKKIDEETDDSIKNIEEDARQFFYNTWIGDFIVKKGSKEKKITYKIIEANSTYYLDISCEFSNINDSIPFLEELNETLYYNKNSEFSKKYIPIISYDTVSEYYCNQVYPLLNKFERKFRKLLFLIYTSQFQKLYFEKTISQRVKERVNRIIKNENEVYKIQNYFYSLEFGTLQDLLFEKNWTELEEKEIEKLLDKKISELPEKELKNNISNIRPKNDWERFFGNKGFEEDLQNTMKEIAKLRNSVAHNKLFTKKNYQDLKQMLEKNIKTIDYAIEITETEDFLKINIEKFNESIKNMAKSISKIVNDYKNSFLGISDTINDLCSSIGIPPKE